MSFVYDDTREVTLNFKNGIRSIGHFAIVSLMLASALVLSGLGAQTAHALDLQASASDYVIYCAPDGKMHKNTADGDVIANTSAISWACESGSAGTLTMSGCDFTTTAPTAICIPESATVVLAGTNKVTTMGGTTALQARGNMLAIQGSGSLTLSTYATNDAASNAYGLYCDGALTVNDATLVTQVTTSENMQNAYGIFAKGSSSFTNAKATAGYFSGGGRTECLAIASQSGSLTFTSSTIAAESGKVGTNGGKSVGIYAASDVTVDGGKVTARGGNVSVRAAGDVSGSSEGIYAMNGMIFAKNGAEVTASSGNVEVESANGGAATATSRGVYIGKRSPSTKTYSKLDGASTKLDVTAGNAIGRGGAGSSSKSVGIQIYQSTNVQLQINSARVTLKAGNAGASDVPSTDCGSYGFYGETATWLNGGYLSSVAGTVSTSATAIDASSSSSDKKIIGSYGYMGTVGVQRTFTFIVKGGPINTVISDLTEGNGSFGWGRAPTCPQAYDESVTYGTATSPTSNNYTVDQMVLSGYTGSQYTKKTGDGCHLNLSAYQCRVGDEPDGSDKHIYNADTDGDRFSHKYVQVGQVKTIAVPTVTKNFVYNGTKRTAVVEGAGYTLSGTASATNAGNYAVTASLVDGEGSVWSDGTTDAKVFAWTIAKRASAVSLANKTATYTGSPVFAPSATVTGTSGAVTYAYYSDSGASSVIEAPTDAGTYYMRAFAAEDANNLGAQSSVATLTIKRKAVSAPVVATGLVYNGTKQTGVSAGVGYSLSGIAEAIDAGTYTVTANLSDSKNTCWVDGSIADKTCIWSMDPRRIAFPEAETNTVYTGSPITGVKEGEGYTLEGNVATDVGNYTAIVRLASGNYAWSDGDTSAQRTVSWAIYRYASTITLANLTCVYDGKPHKIAAAAVKGSAGAVSYAYYSDAKLASKLTSIPVDAGVYYVRATVTPAGDYAGAVSNVATLTIGKAANAISGASSFVKAGKAGKQVSFDLGQSVLGGTLSYASSKPKYVSVDAAGKATILKNYTGKIAITIQTAGDKNYKAASKTVYVFAKPGKMATPKAVNVKTRSVKVSWTKMVGADKYQVQRALNKKFTKGKKTYSVSSKLKSKKLTKLKKGKTYYIRVRAYDKQTKSWGAWSTAKKVKIRK